MSILSLPYATSMLSIAVPALLLAASTSGVAYQAGLFASPAPAALLYRPETVTVAPREFSYRADGEFFKRSHVIDPPVIRTRERRPLTIMKFQVTNAEYNACVAEGVCKPAEIVAIAGEPNMPVTGVSFDDATAYANWLSHKTGAVWTLPTDRQVAFAAGREFPDDALGIDPDNKNPALRWLADYKREAAEKALRDTGPRPAGSFGFNEFGIADFGGNVWEWTTTCHRRVHLDISGVQATAESVCGVYVTVGKHRSPMSSFVRDPKGGGCAVGTPPANLGFRLVLDDRWYAPLLAKLRNRGLSL
jgi:formylglycine-generating enzyme required for sulfatase activity